jgi:hypothetical protein
MITSISLSCLSVAAILGAVSAPAASYHAAKVEAESTASATDITASSPWWDLCLLYNGGDANTFNAFSQCVRGDGRYGFFQLAAARPYKTDLYLYFYVDVDNGAGFSYDAASAAYAVTASSATKGSDGKVSSSSLATKALTMVGKPYNVGTQYLSKYVIPGLFPSASSGSTFDVALGTFGTVSDSAYSALFQLDYEQTFTYTDDQYDITTQLWGDKASTVSLVAEDAQPMTVKENTAEMDNSILSGFLGGSVLGSSSGYYEDHFVFFDLDRDPDEILAVDFYYTMVEYYKEAVYMSMGRLGDQDWVFYDTPVGDAAKYAASDGINKTYAPTMTKRIANCQMYDAGTSKVHTIDNVETGSSWLPPFSVSYTRHIPQIINLSTVDESVGDSSTASWLKGHAVKSDGSLYQYAVCVEATERSWHGKSTRTTTDYLWGFIPTQDDWWALYQSHTAQGIVSGKMTVIADGKQLEWNTFSQATNEKPDAPADSHTYTFNELLVAMAKSGWSWIVAIIMAAYWVVASLAVLGLTVLIAGSGSQTVKVEASGKGK